jgi:pyruvate,water dikinase
MDLKNFNSELPLEKKIGGKARNLLLLKKEGFNVPDFFVISHTDFENSKLKDIVKNLIYKIQPLKEEIILRSSATGEDGGENSFAGIFESVRINKLSNLNSELKRILGSLASEKLYSYIKSKKIKEKPKLSVIIQEFIEGDVSGVIFSSVTKAGKRGTLINSGFGGASSIVNGQDSDYFFLNQRGDIVEKTKSKERYSLTKTQIISLLKIAKKIESLFGKPQDIEFTIKNNNIYLLQSRPITKDISEEILVWDNSNIAESYSGIILPLTSSYIRYAYQVTYIDLARKSGVSKEKIKENQHLFNNLLGFFYGRVYYNMLNWYKMLTLYPGYERNKRNLDIMISAKSREELNSQYKQNVSKLFKLKYYTKLFLRYPFFNNEIRGFKLMVKDYLSYFNKTNLNDLNQEDLIKIYHNSVSQLLNKWSVTVESDFLLMTYFGMLKKFCKKNNLEGSFIQFVSDIKNVISANQVNYLSKLSEEFNKFEELINLANKRNYRVCLREINSNLKYKFLKDSIQNYLKEYGGRFANELKLETEDLDTNPEYIIKLLLLYAKRGLKANHNKKVPIKSLKLSLTKKGYLNYILKKIKFYARQREEMRLLRAQSFSIARKIFFEIGKRFNRRGILNNAEDIFYLEIDEIISYIDKKSKDKNLIKIVNIRKKQYNEYETKELEDVFYTYGYSISSKFTKTTDKDSNSTLRGQGCSSGIVKGKVKIMNSFSLPDKGIYDIVVTKHTDPGWTPLFGLCKGIIVEHGGLLSHASIISRELNLPCIIGLKNATKLFKDGQTITINGFSGEVTIHD